MSLSLRRLFVVSLTVALSAACADKHSQPTRDAALEEDADTPIDEQEDADLAPDDAAAFEPEAGPTSGDAQVVDLPLDAGEDAALDAGRELPGVIPGKGFADAPRIDLTSGALLVNERSADQVDYFVFRVEAGAFYEVSTDDGFFAPDNTIALYDSERRLLAQNDDGSAGWADGVDARLVFHAARAGDVFLKVEDLYTPASFFKSDFALLYYYLRVRKVGSETPGYAEVKPDGTTEALFVHDDQTGYEHVTLLGLFRPTPVTCSFAGAAQKVLMGHVLLGGAEHDGSTFAAGRVEISSADAGVVARIDRGTGQENIYPPIEEGRYTVRVDAQDGGLGDNPYFAIDLVQLPENPREEADAANSALAGAEPITLMGTTARRGLLLTRLPVGDVDYYRFELAAGDGVRAGCEAESAGSGVRMLTAEIRNAADAKLSASTESPLESLNTPQVKVEAAGTYYLRLSAAAEAPVDAIDPWVRCALLINR
jgi:hypothetical protein